MSDFLYCLNASTIRPVPILKKIEIAGKAGYAAIELWHDDIDAHLADGGTLAEIRHAVDDQNLDVPTTIYLKGWFETTGPAHTASALISGSLRNRDRATGCGMPRSIA